MRQQPGSAVNGSRANFRFEVAGPEHDAALGRLSAVPMDGAIRVSLQRKPSYLEATAVEGAFRQVLVAVDRPGAHIAATASRSVRIRYVNGQSQPVGYLSALRCLEAHRRQTLLARGYAFLRRLHEDGRAALYVTTIAADNTTALRALTSRRCGLPAYEPAGMYETLVIPARRRRHLRLPIGLSIRTATPEDLEPLVAFTQRSCATRQFAPRYESSDFFRPAATFRDLRAEDVRLAFRGRRLVGTLASWDQSGFKQTVVQGYGGALRWLRPGYNAWAGMRGRPRLPRAGTPLRHRMLALPLVEGDDPEVLRALLDVTLDDHARRAAREPGCRLALLGLHESDPLLSAVRRYGARSYETRLFVVHWDDGTFLHDALDDRPAYLELGCL